MRRSPRGLEKLHGEPRAITTEARAAADLAALRARRHELRRHELDLAISQQERALEEALRVLEPPRVTGAVAGAAHV